MCVSHDQLERAYRAMIDIVSARSDGEKYMPIIFRLERELAESETTAAAFERIKAMAS